MESIGSEIGSLEPSWTARVSGLWTEVFGDVRSSEPVLLLSEAEAPCTRWPDVLVATLTGALGALVRFDTRDAGRNPVEEHPYGLGDLARDAAAVLEGLGVPRAHVVGRSMGGMIAQIVALEHPERVASLTLVSTTGGPAPELPGPEAWLVDRMAERLFGRRPGSIHERAEWIVDQLEWFSGPRFEFDRPTLLAAALVEAEHMWHGPSRHGEAVVNAAARYGRLDRIVVPTLIVHGTADPVYPADHALALATGIDSARLELIEGLGHELPAEFCPQLAALIVDHVAAT